MFKDLLIKLALPLVIAALVVPLTQWTKKAWSWLDKQHPLVKQGVVAAYTAAFAAVAATVGKSICVDGSAFCDPTLLDWKAILSVAFAGALAMHGWKKAK